MKSTILERVIKNYKKGRKERKVGHGVWRGKKGKISGSIKKPLVAHIPTL